jgi:hypothetical protein
MLTAKRTIVLGVIALTTAGLLYSQLCSIRCAVYVCSQPAPPRIVQQSEPSSHCQHDAPEPQEQGDPSACLTHTEIAALLPPGGNPAVAPGDNIQPSTVEPLFTTSNHLDALAYGKTPSPPDRSPPGSAFSVLRI